MLQSSEFHLFQFFLLESLFTKKRKKIPNQLLGKERGGPALATYSKFNKCSLMAAVHLTP